jgi:hypothetical protein
VFDDNGNAVIHVVEIGSSEKKILLPGLKKKQMPQGTGVDMWAVLSNRKAGQAKRGKCR